MSLTGAWSFIQMSLLGAWLFHTNVLNRSLLFHKKCPKQELGYFIQMSLSGVWLFHKNVIILVSIHTKVLQNSVNNNTLFHFLTKTYEMDAHVLTGA